MQVNDVDIDAFKKAVAPVWDSFLNREGELAEQLVKLAHEDMGIPWSR